MENNGLMTTGEHLEVLRKMFLRILFAVLATTITIFLFKNDTFRIILAPKNSEFIFYRAAEKIAGVLGLNLHFNEFDIELISTEISSQFMLHITTSLYVAILLVSPYILIELICFISPALYRQEKKYSIPVAITSYIMFGVGIVLTYYVLFPFAFRFLGTYQVDESVHNTITLSSYISTLISMSLIMGVVFQFPVLSFILGKAGLLRYEHLAGHRKLALMVIMTVSAVITPPDLFTLIMVSLPLYALYELSILILHTMRRQDEINQSDL
ncbi:MAG: twin-arginine translocase subunit TatC [Candidatus Cryptobacteroides sp.]